MERDDLLLLGLLDGFLVARLRGAHAELPVLSLERKEVDGTATTYVCQAFSCRAPTVDTETLVRGLA